MRVNGAYCGTIIVATNAEFDDIRLKALEDERITNLMKIEGRKPLPAVGRMALRAKACPRG